MRKLLKGKLKFVILAIAVLSVGTMLTTLSLLSDVTETKANSFSSGIVNIKIDENFSGGDIRNGKITKQARVMNSSENGQLNVVPVYIRARLVSSWKDAAGNVMAVDSDTLFDYHFTDNTSWVKGDDGYFYYTKPVQKDSYTEYLLDSVEKKTNVTLPSEGNLEVQVLADGIQIYGDAMKDTWGAPTVKGVNINFQK